jgi:hypothetical protein
VLSIVNPPEGPVPGLEKMAELTVGERNFYFCCMTHLIAFALAWVKASEADVPKYRAHVAMEELESIPPMPDLNLRD